jgi:hypothetical protein
MPRRPHPVAPRRRRSNSSRSRSRSTMAPASPAQRHPTTAGSGSKHRGSIVRGGRAGSPTWHQGCALHPPRNREDMAEQAAQRPSCWHQSCPAATGLESSPHIPTRDVFSDHHRFRSNAHWPAFSLVRACVEPPAGIEPATPSLPSMRGWFTTPHSTSRARASAQVGGPATPRLVRRGEAERGVVSGKSLARHVPIRILKLEILDTPGLRSLWDRMSEPRCHASDGSTGDHPAGRRSHRHA